MLNKKIKALTPVNHFDNEISYFETVKSITPITITLEKWLNECINPSKEYINYKNQIQTIRKTGNKELKMLMPAISPGAIINTRSKHVDEKIKVTKVTGWMQFDIDFADNPTMLDPEYLRDEVRKIIYVAYCSLSVSGKGIWGLIKIKSVEDYREHFEQLKIDFASRGIKLDPTKGGNPTDLRLYSFDPKAYIASDFKIYDRKLKVKSIPRAKKISLDNVDDSDTTTQVNKLIREILRKGIDIAPDYETYRNIGFAFSNEFKEGGRDLFHAVCSPSSKYNTSDADKQYTNCLKNTGTGITIATFFYLCKQAGIRLRTEKKTIVPKSLSREVRKKTLTISDHPNKPSNISCDDIQNSIDDKDSIVIKNETITAFVDTTGNLYISISFTTNFSKYPSVSHYNDRVCLPEFVDNLDISRKDLFPVTIDLNTLSIL